MSYKILAQDVDTGGCSWIFPIAAPNAFATLAGQVITFASGATLTVPTGSTFVGGILTLSDGSTIDIANLDTDTFATAVAGVITFADGSTMDVNALAAAADTDTFASVVGQVITFASGATLTVPVGSTITGNTITASDGSTLDIDALISASEDDVSAVAVNIVGTNLVVTVTEGGVPISGTIPLASIAGAFPADSIPAAAVAAGTHSVTTTVVGTDLVTTVTINGVPQQGTIPLATLLASMLPANTAGHLENDGAGNLSWVVPTTGTADDDITAVSIAIIGTDLQISVTEPGAGTLVSAIPLASLATAVLATASLDDIGDVPAYPTDGLIYELQLNAAGVPVWVLDEDLAPATAVGVDSIGNPIAIGDEVLTLSNGDTINISALGPSGATLSVSATGQLMVPDFPATTVDAEKVVGTFTVPAQTLTSNTEISYRGVGWLRDTTAGVHNTGATARLRLNSVTGPIIDEIFYTAMDGGTTNFLRTPLGLIYNGNLVAAGGVLSGGNITIVATFEAAANVENNAMGSQTIVYTVFE